MVVAQGNEVNSPFCLHILKIFSWINLYSTFLPRTLTIRKRLPPWLKNYPFLLVSPLMLITRGQFEGPWLWICCSSSSHSSDLKPSDSGSDLEEQERTVVDYCLPLIASMVRDSSQGPEVAHKGRH